MQSVAQYPNKPKRINTNKLEQKAYNYADLSPKQTKVLAPLAAGESAADVSKKYNISQQQISAWTRHDPVFRSAIHNERHNNFTAANHAFGNLANEAVCTLKNLMVNAKNEQVQLKAAMFIIERTDVCNQSGKSEQPPIIEGECFVNMDMLLSAIGITQEDML